MTRRLLEHTGTFITLGGGILLTIFLVRALDAPLLVFPAVIVILAVTGAVSWFTADPALSPDGKRRKLMQSLEG